jgi:hypothetical protein
MQGYKVYEKPEKSEKNLKSSKIMEAIHPYRARQNHTGSVQMKVKTLSKWVKKSKISRIKMREHRRIVSVSLGIPALFLFGGHTRRNLAQRLSHLLVLRPCAGGKPPHAGAVRLHRVRLRGKRRSGRRDQCAKSGTRPVSL